MTSKIRTSQLEADSISLDYVCGRSSGMGFNRCDTEEDDVFGGPVVW